MRAHARPHPHAAAPPTCPTHHPPAHPPPPTHRRRIYQYYLPVFTWCRRQLDARRAAGASGPLVLGISAPQGCGKTTLCEQLEDLFAFTGKCEVYCLTYCTHAGPAKAARPRLACSAFGPCARVCVCVLRDARRATAAPTHTPCSFSLAPSLPSSSPTSPTPRPGATAAAVSIDDFYLTHADQRATAAAHPGNLLLELRGNAGSHDVGLGTDTLRTLRAAVSPGDEVALPR